MSEQEDKEQTPRRRSARIVALEQKRERQKKAQEEARKNRADAKGKGKAVVNNNNGEEDYYGFIHDEDIDEEDDEYANPNNRRRGRKSRPLNQLISLTQPIQGGACNGYSGSYGQPRRTLPKETLGFGLDLIQSKDTDEFFAQPVNPDHQDHRRIVKEPMDFGTMRAKLHENMYTNFDQFKRDVYLICSNAMNANPSSTNPHQAAQVINKEASRVFNGLSDPETFEMAYDFGPDDKKPKGRKSHGRSKSSSARPRQLPPKPPAGGNSGANHKAVKAAEVVDKRQTYRPTGADSIFSEVLDGPKSNLQFYKPSCYYQESLLRFLEGMGPTVKKYAAKQIESLRKSQIMCGEATRPNPLANYLDTTGNNPGPFTMSWPPPPPPLPPSPPPAATRRGHAHDAPRSMHHPNTSNRPLTIPGFTPQAPQETRNNINSDRTGDYKGKKVMVDPKENWDSYAASSLSSYFMNNNNKNEGGGSRSERGLNLNGEGSSSAPSFHQNRSSFQNMPSSFQAANLYQNQNRGMQWIDPPETSNARNPGTQVHTRVWPSVVISGPQAQSRPNTEPTRTSDRQAPPGTAGTRPLSRQQEATVGQTLSDHSLLSQNLAQLDFSLLRQALWSQQIPAEQVNTGNNNFTWQSYMPHNNQPAMLLNENNSSRQSFMPQQIPQEAMNMNSYNFTGQALMSQQNGSNSNPIMNAYNNNNAQSGGGQSLMQSQQRPEEVGHITGGQSYGPHQSDLITWKSFILPQKKPQDDALTAQAVTGYYENLSAPAAGWTEEGTSNSYMGNANRPDDFQTIWAPIDLNSIPITDHPGFYNAPPEFIDNSRDLIMIEPKPEPELELEPDPEPAQLNPLGLFPRQMPTPLPSSSASLEMPMGLNAMNYYVGGNAVMGEPVAGGGGEGPSTTVQLQWDDDHQPNLSLQL